MSRMLVGLDAGSHLNQQRARLCVERDEALNLKIARQLVGETRHEFGVTSSLGGSEARNRAF